MKSRISLLSVLDLLFLIYFQAVAVEPETIAQVPGRWDNWQVTPVVEPLCDAYHNGPTLSYILPDSSRIESDVYLSLAGELNEETVLPLRDISAAGVVDNNGTIWIADLAEDRSYQRAENAKSLSLLETNDIWTGWLGVYECDVPDGVFVFSFRNNSAKDSLTIDLLLNDVTHDSTFMKTGPMPLLNSFNGVGDSPKVFIHSYEFEAPVLFSFYEIQYLSYYPPVVVWWYDSMIATVTCVVIQPPDYDWYRSSRSVAPADTGDFLVVGNAAYPDWAVFGNLQSSWQICNDGVPIDTVLSLNPPRLAVPQWGSTDQAAWAYESFISGWNISWLDMDGNILSLSERKEIDRIHIEIYRGGSSRPCPGGTSYGGYVLFWSEYDSESDVTTLYKIRNWTVGVDEQPSYTPKSFELGSVWPNPFNSTAQARFYLPEATRVKAELYNLIGQRVCTISNRPYAPGYHMLRIDGNGLSSGVYLLKIAEENGLSVVKRVTLIR